MRQSIIKGGGNVKEASVIIGGLQMLDSVGHERRSLNMFLFLVKGELNGSVLK